MALDPLYSIEEAAAYLRVSPRTVRRIIADGKIAYLPQRGGRLLTETALRRYVTAAEVVRRRAA